MTPGGEAILSAAFARLDLIPAAAGSRIVTLSQVDLAAATDPVLRARVERAAARRDVAQILRQEALISLVRSYLMVEAGHTLGFDPETIDMALDYNVEQNIERSGGHIAFSEFLESQNMTPSSYREFISTRIFADAWRNSVTGKSAGATGRIYVDRYISPGELKASYDQFKASPRLIEKAVLGIFPERVVLDRLVVAEIPGSVNSAEDRARGLREQAEEGHSFSGIIRMHGVIPVNDTKTQPLPVELLRVMSRENHGSDELWNFAREAEAGKFIGPLRMQSPGGRVSWIVYKLEERLPATEALPFESLELQKRLREHLLGILDRNREETAFRTFASQAYIYPEAVREALDL